VSTPKWDKLPGILGYFWIDPQNTLYQVVLDAESNHTYELYCRVDGREEGYMGRFATAAEAIEAAEKDSELMKADSQ